MIGTPEEIAKYLWKLDKEKLYQIDEYKEKRSLNANGICGFYVKRLQKN